MKKLVLGAALFVGVLSLCLAGTAGINPAYASAVLEVDPSEGSPGDSLVIKGADFEDGETVQVSLLDSDVPYIFGQAEAEGGSFTLEPKGGIPKPLEGPGTYEVNALGDQGTTAEATLMIN